MSNWKKLLLNYFLIIVNEDKNIEKNRKLMKIKILKKIENFFVKMKISFRFNYLKKLILIEKIKLF